MPGSVILAAIEMTPRLSETVAAKVASPVVEPVKLTGSARVVVAASSVFNESSLTLRATTRPSAMVSSMTNVRVGWIGPGTGSPRRPMGPSEPLVVDARPNW